MPVEPNEISKEQLLAADAIDPVKAIISRYKRILQEKGLADELYKWELVKQNMHKLDTSVNDFASGLISVLGNNLFYYMPVATAKELATKKPNEYRQCYIDLFNENTALEQRITTFTSAVDALYRSLGHDNLAHHDERTASNMLTFHDPTKYTFFKDSYYQKYCKIIKEKPSRVGGKYPHYLRLMQELIETYINVDTELIELVNRSLPFCKVIYLQCRQLAILWSLHELTFYDFSLDGIGLKIQGFVDLFMAFFGDTGIENSDGFAISALHTGEDKLMIAHHVAQAAPRKGYIAIA